MMDRFQNTAQPDRDWWSALWPDPGGTVRRLGLAPDDRALDVCSGDGHFTVPMARVVAPHDVLAIDVDDDLLERAATRAADAGLDNVETVVCDARDLDTSVEGTVDFALLANTLHGADDPVEVLRTVRSVLAEDGRFAVINWEVAAPGETPVLDEPRGPPERLRMAADETEQTGTTAGFEPVDRIALPPHHYGIVFRLDADG